MVQFDEQTGDADLQSRRDDPKPTQGGANVSETNVPQPWDTKFVDHRTPKGWP